MFSGEGGTRWQPSSRDRSSSPNMLMLVWKGQEDRVRSAPSSLRRPVCGPRARCLVHGMTQPGGFFVVECQPVGVFWPPFPPPPLLSCYSPVPLLNCLLPDAPAAVVCCVFSLFRRKTTRLRCLWLVCRLRPSGRLLSTTSSRRCVLIDLGCLGFGLSAYLRTITAF